MPSAFSVRIISRLIVVGTSILGILSGFGAVNNAWNHFPRLSKKEMSVYTQFIFDVRLTSHSLRRSRKKPTQEEVSVAEEGLRRIRDDLLKRRQELEKLQESQVSISIKVGVREPR